MADRSIKTKIVTHLIALVGGAGIAAALLLNRGEEARPPVSAPVKKLEQPVARPKPPVLPATPSPIDRQALLRATAQAADAVASGNPLPQSNAALVGQSFVLRLPFGCAGEMVKGGNDWAGWTFDPKTRALRLTANPEHFEKADWVKDMIGKTPVDAIEGFWLRRPWTSAETCPKQPAAEVLAAISDRQTVGIAQFFSPDGSRTLRRGTRAYTFTLKLDDDEAERPGTFILELRGRISKYADGQPVHCSQDTPSASPRCIIAVEFERVAFRQSSEGEVLIEWH